MIRETNSCRPTNYEHFDFADVHLIVDQRKMDNEISEAESLFIDVSTLDRNCRSGRHSARILTTQGVFPQNRCAILKTVIR